MIKNKINLYVVLAVLLMFTLSADAITQSDQTNAEYLKKQGYSPEIIRLVDMQKTRTDGTTVSDESSIKDSLWTTKAKKVVKQMFRMSDVTMSPDFGNNRIKF